MVYLPTFYHTIYHVWYIYLHFTIQYTIHWVFGGCFFCLAAFFFRIIFTLVTSQHGWGVDPRDWPQGNLPPPGHVPPPRNKGLIAGLIKGNQWLISLISGGGTLGGGRLTSHEFSLCAFFASFWFFPKKGSLSCDHHEIIYNLTPWNGPWNKAINKNTLR